MPDSPVDKSPTNSATLAQRLASESSWADRYVPATPAETVMTPASSVAEHSEQQTHESEYLTPNEAPPAYEEATTTDETASNPSQPRSQPSPFAAESQPGQALVQRPRLPGRRYSRHETSQSINGNFTLQESLNLSTTSGSIRIKIDVQPGSDPAYLRLKSNSGSISVNDNQCDAAMGRSDPSHPSTSRCGRSSLFSFLWGSRSTCQSEPPPIPTSDDPRKQPGQILSQHPESPEPTPAARVIHTTIETASGSVSCHLLLTATSSTHIQTTSGSINMRLVTADTASSSSPLLTRTPNKLEAEDSRLSQASSSPSSKLTSTVTTTTQSGSQNIRITTGVADSSSGAIVSACEAKHHSKGSGSLHIDYPSNWSGLVHASCGGCGSVNVRGSGLEFDRRGNREVWAWRGVDLPDVDKAVEVRCDGSGSMTFGC